MRAYLKLTTVLASGLLLVPAPSLAQATPESTTADSGQVARTNRYDAAFFAKSSPRTAFDIVRLVPGFTIESGNAELRGFSGAAGNIVINGARPSSKAEDIAAVLARIPASRVQAVEVGAGERYGSEYASKAQVLNIILTAEGGIDGNAEVWGSRLFNGRIVTGGNGSLLWKRGATSVNVAAGLGIGDYVEEGSDTLYDAGGTQYEYRRKVNDIRPHSPFVSVNFGHEPSQERAIHFNARFNPDRLDLYQANHVTPTVGPERDDRLTQDFRTRTIELGGDIARPLAGGVVKLVGLATRRKRDNEEIYFVRIDDQLVGGDVFNARAKRNETIGRLSWSHPNMFGFNFDTGGEIAYNTLDSQNDFFNLLPSGDKVPVFYPVSNVTVIEKRAEAFVNLGRQFGPALRVDTGLTAETSRLKVSGDAQAKRALTFLKPSLTIDWKPGGKWHTRFIARRTVAQLDFYDFVTNAELSTGKVNGGNSNLQPQRAWELRFTADHPILGDGLVKLDVGHDVVSLLQDRVVTEDGLDAPGNIGTGKRTFAELNVDAPLAKLGIKGGRLQLRGRVQDTKVDDPVSGTTRGWSGFWPKYEWGASYRHDFRNVSLGFDLENRSSFSFYRISEIDRNFNFGAYLGAFVEYRPDKVSSVTLNLNNLLDNGGGRERSFYDPNRSNPLVDSTEIRERNSHVQVRLTYKRSFSKQFGLPIGASAGQ